MEPRKPLPPSSTPDRATSRGVQTARRPVVAPVRPTPVSSPGGVLLPRIAPPSGGSRTSNPTGSNTRVVWTTPRTLSVDAPQPRRPRPPSSQLSSSGLRSADSGEGARFGNEGEPACTSTASPNRGGDDDQAAQLKFMDQMVRKIQLVNTKLDKETHEAVDLHARNVEYQVGDGECATLDAVHIYGTKAVEESESSGGFGAGTAMTSAREATAAAPANQDFRSHQPRSISSPQPTAVLAKDQLELCAALGKNAELRIRSRAVERQADQVSSVLEQTQRQMNMADRRIVNREEKLRAVLKEKLHWQNEIKDLRRQVIEGKMRQVDLMRRLETVKRETSTQLEVMAETVRNTDEDNQVLLASLNEAKNQLAFQTKRLDDVVRQAREEKDRLTACIVEARNKLRDWKQSQASSLNAQRDQAHSKAEYEHKIARHQGEIQKLRDEVKDLEVSDRLMQNNRSLSPLELSRRKATILGSRDSIETTEVEPIEANVRINELEAMLEHSHEFQKRQESIINIAEGTISRLIEDREVAALDTLAHPRSPANGLWSEPSVSPDYSPLSSSPTKVRSQMSIMSRSSRQIAVPVCMQNQVTNSPGPTAETSALRTGQPVLPDVSRAIGQPVRPDVPPPPRSISVMSLPRRLSAERLGAKSNENLAVESHSSQHQCSLREAQLMERIKVMEVAQQDAIAARNDHETRSEPAKIDPAKSVRESCIKAEPNTHSEVAVVQNDKGDISQAVVSQVEAPHGVQSQPLVTELLSDAELPSQESHEAMEPQIPFCEGIMDSIAGSWPLAISADESNAVASGECSSLRGGFEVIVDDDDAGRTTSETDQDARNDLESSQCGWSVGAPVVVTAREMELRADVSAQRLSIGTGDNCRVLGDLALLDSQTTTSVSEMATSVDDSADTSLTDVNQACSATFTRQHSEDEGNAASHHSKYSVSGASPGMLTEQIASVDDDSSAHPTQSSISSIADPDNNSVQTLELGSLEDHRRVDSEQVSAARILAEYVVSSAEQIVVQKQVDDPRQAEKTGDQAVDEEYLFMLNLASTVASDVVYRVVNASIQAVTSGLLSANAHIGESFPEASTLADADEVVRAPPTKYDVIGASTPSVSVSNVDIHEQPPRLDEVRSAPQSMACNLAVEIAPVAKSTEDQNALDARSDGEIVVRDNLDAGCREPFAIGVAVGCADETVLCLSSGEFQEDTKLNLAERIVVTSRQSLKAHEPEVSTENPDVVAGLTTRSVRIPATSFIIASSAQAVAVVATLSALMPSASANNRVDLGEGVCSTSSTDGALLFYFASLPVTMRSKVGDTIAPATVEAALNPDGEFGPTAEATCYTTNAPGVVPIVRDPAEFENETLADGEGLPVDSVEVEPKMSPTVYSASDSTTPVYGNAATTDDSVQACVDEHFATLDRQLRTIPTGLPNIKFTATSSAKSGEESDDTVVISGAGLHAALDPEASAPIPISADKPVAGTCGGKDLGDAVGELQENGSAQCISDGNPQSLSTESKISVPACRGPNDGSTESRPQNFLDADSAFAPSPDEADKAPTLAPASHLASIASAGSRSDHDQLVRTATPDEVTCSFVSASTSPPGAKSERWHDITSIDQSIPEVSWTERTSIPTVKSPAMFSPGSSRYASAIVREMIRDPTLMAYDVKHEEIQPFSMLDDKILRIDQHAMHMQHDENDKARVLVIAEQPKSRYTTAIEGVLVTKRKKMENEARHKSIAFRIIPAFNYEPVLIKFQWSDFVVATPIRLMSSVSQLNLLTKLNVGATMTGAGPRASTDQAALSEEPKKPQLSTSPIQKMKLIIKKGLKLPCGTYVIISVFKRPLEDGNENLRIQIYDSERVEEFQFDFHEDHVRDYEEDWNGGDGEARAFLARLEFRREQGSIIIKMPEKIRTSTPSTPEAGTITDSEPRIYAPTPMAQLLTNLATTQPLELPPEPHYRISPNAPASPQRLLERPETPPDLLQSLSIIPRIEEDVESSASSVL